MCAKLLSVLLLLSLGTSLLWARRFDDFMEMEEDGMEEDRMDDEEPMENRSWEEMRADNSSSNSNQTQLHIQIPQTKGGGGGGGGESAPKQCSPLGECIRDGDCGEKGRCLGIAVGKCDCSACGQGILCNFGAALGKPSCGGLANACNETSNLCNCDAAYRAQGFKSMGDAILKFCSKQDCDGVKDTCFGLPCKKGHCMCL